MFFDCGMGGKPPRLALSLGHPFSAGGAKPTQTCNGKHIQFISVEISLMFCVIGGPSVMTCSGSASHDQNSQNMSLIHSNLKGFPISCSQTLLFFLFHVHFNLLHLHASFLFYSEGSALFLSTGSLKTWKVMKNRTKNKEHSRIFWIFQFCSILGVFQGNLGQLGALWAVQRRLGGVLGGLGGILEASWRILKAS